MAHGKHPRGSRRRRNCLLAFGSSAAVGARRLKFENLEAKLLLASDFGDAPAPYPTLLADNGARHTASPYKLGPQLDAEADGIASSAADGDGADEDGVQIPLLYAGQSAAKLAVSVVAPNADQPLRLDGWIDFNADSSWDGPSERVFDSRLVYAGVNQFAVTVPAWAAVGTTYARFRLSTQGVAGPRGAASNGEVEDYAVTIAAPLAGRLQFTEHTSSATGATGVTALHAVDLDADGPQDLVAGDSSGQIDWHKNDGRGSFTVKPIGGLSPQPLGGVAVVTAADFDGNGLLDVLADADAGRRTLFGQYANQDFSPLSFSGPGKATVALDIDRDGDLDLLSASSSAGAFYWHENGAGWSVRTIADGAPGASDLAGADLDQDGDLDMLGASAGDNTIAWFENNGAQSFTRHIVASDAVGVTQAILVDLDRDGDLDVLANSPGAGEIRWYENDGARNFTAHIIATLAGVSHIAAADLDGDGSLDVLAAAGEAGAILLRNDGNQEFASQTLSVPTASAVIAADFNGDGVLDVAVSSAASPTIRVLVQQADFDYGDAPAPFPTTAAQNGARHYAAGPTLGAARDADPDGAPSASADGDGPDDDGVTFGPLRIGDASAAATVNVQNAPQGARLDAWIDFDGDGTFSGPNERIAASQPVVEGDNAISFAVPTAIADGAVYARFRLSTAGDLGVTGGATDGEVEDYAVVIEPPGYGGGFGASQELTPGAFWNDSLFHTVDLDRDGDVDLLGSAGSSIYGYDNDGQGGYARRTVGGYSTYSYLTAADLDGDGDVDVVARSNNELHWFANNGGQLFTRRTIRPSDSYAFSSVEPLLTDLDLDGDLDVISADSTGVFVLENNGGEQFAKRYLLAQTFRPYIAFAAADADGDGDVDLFATPEAPSQPLLELLENDGAGTFTVHSVLAGSPSYSTRRPRSFTPLDLDGDGDLDLVAVLSSYPYYSASDKFVGWFENLGESGFAERSFGFGVVQDVAISDLEGDGDFDLVIAVDDSHIVWHEQVAPGRFAQRTHASLNALIPPGYYSDYYSAVEIADVNGDSRLDVFIADLRRGRLSWLPQLAPPEGDYGDAPYPYPVRPSGRGAHHAATGPTLGEARSVDAFPENSADAAGDDDDGITLTPLTVGQIGAMFTVNVQNAPAGALLDAWIDFDRDGNWGRAEEHIAASVALNNGDNQLQFNVPAWAAPGFSYARFRVSTAGGLGYFDAAADGEVEDYAVTILPAAAIPGPYLERHLIDPAGGLASDVASVDLDQDGHGDLVVARQADILWRRGDGQGGFTSQVLVAGQGAAAAVAATDIDQDGDVDLFAQTQAGLLWWENDGAEAFTPHIVDASIRIGHIIAADVDGDGDVDAASDAGYYINDGGQTFSRRLISSFIPWSSAAALADMDADGDLDLVGPTSFNGRLVYWEYTGTGFVERPLIDQFVFQGVTAAVDVDGDGDLDLLRASVTLRLFENQGALSYVERSLGAVPAGLSELLAADLNGDGRLDLVAAGIGGTAWFEQQADGGFTRRAVLSEGGPAALADVDGDGRLDLVASTPPYLGYGPAGLAWYSFTDRQIAVSPAATTTLAEETAASLAVSFTREGDLSDQATVSFTVSGTAVLGADYEIAGASTITPTGGTVVFPAGGAAVEIQLSALDDGVKELDETVRIELQPLAGYGVGAWTSVVKITSAELAGDYVEDSLVDGLDFLAWQRTLGETADPPGSGADGDRDGQIDADDLAEIWSKNFGRGLLPPDQTLAPFAPAGTVALTDAALMAAFADYGASAPLALASGPSSARPSPRVKAAPLPPPTEPPPAYRPAPRQPLQYEPPLRWDLF
ncbi:MAG: VCBS repeat-containing protein [Pirellulales bacterium]|nr:VCBS repeat-containing protein [Pirellulales bacterium]